MFYCSSLGARLVEITSAAMAMDIEVGLRESDVSCGRPHATISTAGAGCSKRPSKTRKVPEDRSNGDTSRIVRTWRCQDNFTRAPEIVVRLCACTMAVAAL